MDSLEHGLCVMCGETFDCPLPEDETISHSESWNSNSRPHWVDGKINKATSYVAGYNSIMKFADFKGLFTAYDQEYFALGQEDAKSELVLREILKDEADNY